MKKLKDPLGICMGRTRSGSPCTKDAVTIENGKPVCHLHSVKWIKKRSAKMKANGVVTGGAAHKANGEKPKRKYTKRSVRWTNGQEIEVQAFGEFGAVLLKAVRLAVRAELREMVGR